MPLDFGTEKQDEGALEACQRLAAEALTLQEQSDDLAATKKSIDDRIAEILRGELPKIMNETGFTDFTLSSGKRFKLVDFVSGSMPKDEAKKQAFYSWLSEQGSDDIIKCDVIASFGKGGHNEAAALRADLEMQGHKAELKQGVHHSTLNSFLLDVWRSEGELPPESIMPVFVGQVAKIEK